MDKETIIAAVFFIAIAVCLVMASVALHKEQLTCESKAGVYIRTGFGFVCVDARTIKLKDN
jgi:hypothetical protein